MKNDLVIKTLSTQRENLGLDKIADNTEIGTSLCNDELVIDQVDRTANITTKLLNRVWYLKQEDSAENERVEVIDLNTLLEKYTHEEIQEKIVPNLAQIGLTQGCNGGCHFCYGMPEKGITKILGIDSIKNFISMNEKEIPAFTFYTSTTDPFDYNKGENNYLSLVKFIHENYQDRSLYTSTVIPKGSQRLFLETLIYMFVRFGEGKNPQMTLRVCVNEQNIQRIEAVMLKFEQFLSGWDKYPQSDLQKAKRKFLKEIVQIETRFKNEVAPLGKSIKKNDDFSKVTAPPCKDGVRINPDGIVYEYMLSANKFNPKGYGVEKSFINKEIFYNWTLPTFIIKNKTGNLNSYQPILGNVFKNETKNDLNILLSRETLNLGNILVNTNIDNLELLDDINDIGEYIDTITKIWNYGLQSYVKNLLSKSSRFIAENNINGDEEIAYNYEILSYFYRKIEKLFQIEKMTQEDGTSFLYYASFLNVLGKTQVDTIKIILDKSLLTKEQVQNIKKIKKEKIMYKEIYTTIYENIGDFFDDDLSHIRESKHKELSLPDWMVFLSCCNHHLFFIDKNKELED